MSSLSKSYAFLIGTEALRTDACSSVVAVLRQSYYLVIDLQSKAAYSGPVLVSLFSQLSLDPAMQAV